MRVLVTGATGFIGSRLVPALREAGHEVVALSRDPGEYEGEADRVVGGDLLDPDLDLPDAAAAYYLVHSMRSGGDFEERDRRAARNFAGTFAGDRAVYLGGLGESRDDLSPHLRSRREVEEILGEGGYDLTTLRAGIIVGAGSASFEMVRQLAVRLPVMVTPKWVRTECQPVAVADVIEYLVGLLDAPATAGGTYEIGGPEVMSYETVLRRTARIATGREPLVLRAPVLSPKLSTYWVNLVTDVPKHVARPLVLGLKNPVVVHDDSIRDHLPFDRTPFDEAVARALREGGHRVAAEP